MDSIGESSPSTYGPAGPAEISLDVPSAIGPLLSFEGGNSLNLGNGVNKLALAIGKTKDRNSIKHVHFCRIWQIRNLNM